MMNCSETRGNSAKNYSRICEICGKGFRDNFDLKRHKERVHEKGRTSSQNLCPLCKIDVAENRAKHLEEFHQIVLERETLRFDTIELFNDWKEKMEKDTCSKYVKHTGSRKNKDGTQVTYLHCHRDGYFSSESQGKRSLKFQGSNKIDGYCPAQIIVRENNQVVAEFVKTHLSHSLDFVPLSRTEREKKKRALKKALKMSVVKDEPGACNPQEFENSMTSSELSNKEQPSIETLKAEVLDNVKRLLDMAETAEDIEVLRKQIAPVESIMISLQNERNSFEIADELPKVPVYKKIYLLLKKV